MEMQGTRQLAVTQQQAWEALNDPEVLKTCVPGCDRMERTEDNQYAVGMTVKIGPVSAKFTGKITLSDIQPPDSYTIAFEGQGGAAGFGKGRSRVTLVPQRDGCELQYTVSAQVGGKVAQLGQRLIDGAAKSMAEDFFKRFDEEMQKRYPSAELPAEEVVGDAAAALVSTGSTPMAATATAATQDAPDTRPGSGIPAWVWAAGLVVVLAAIWVFKS